MLTTGVDVAEVVEVLVALAVPFMVWWPPPTSSVTEFELVLERELVVVAVALPEELASVMVLTPTLVLVPVVWSLESVIVEVYER